MQTRTRTRDSALETSRSRCVALLPCGRSEQLSVVCLFVRLLILFVCLFVCFLIYLFGCSVVVRSFVVCLFVCLFVCSHPKLVLEPSHPEYASAMELLREDSTTLHDVDASPKLAALKHLLQALSPKPSQA